MSSAIQLIAPSVKLGQGVRIFGFTNLYGCEIGDGTKVWHFCHIQSGAKIGRNCVLGQNVNVAGGVSIGDGVKVQNNVSIYTGTIIEDFVFLGPSCVLTNVTNPRSEVNRHALYERTVIRRGACPAGNLPSSPGRAEHILT